MMHKKLNERGRAIHFAYIRAIWLLLAIGLWNQANAQINTNTFFVGLQSDDITACSGGNSTFSIRSKADDAHAFQLTVDLSDGISYVSGSITIVSQTGSSDFTVSEVDVSDPNQPIFGIERPNDDPWQVNDEVHIRISKTSNCDAIQFSYAGGLFKDVHTITFEDTSGTVSNSDTDLTVNSYNLFRPSLALSDIDPMTLNVGESEQRNISITNSGNGNLTIFEHFAEVPLAFQASYSLSFNGTILTPTSSSGTIFTYSIDLSQAPFLGNVGDGDALFENETIVLREEVSMDNCTTTDLFIKHHSEWGCSSSDTCQTTNQPVGDIILDQYWPSFELTAINTPTPQLNSASTYTVELLNYASAENAYNVNFNVGFGWVSDLSSPWLNPLYGTDYRNDRTVSNFRFTNGTAFTPTRWEKTDETGYGLGSYLVGHDLFTSDPDGPGGLEDLDGDGFFDDMAPGATTQLNLDLSFSPLIPGCSEDSSQYIYFEQLQVHMWSTNLCGNLTQQHNKALNETDVYVDGLFNWSDPERFDPDIEEGATSHLSFIGNFKTGGAAPTCNGIDLISNDASTTYTVSMTVPNGVTLDSSASSDYTQSGNTIQFQISNLEDYQIDGWEMKVPIDFPLNIDCAIYSGASSISIPFSINYNSSCFNRQLHCGDFELEAHCNTSCDGAVTSGFEANRVTAGWTDNSMTTKVTLDPNTHDVKMYMPRDEMVINTSAFMRNEISDNLFFEMRYVTDNSGVDMSDIIQFESGTITINDLSSGSQSTAITINPTVTTQGTNDNTMLFDLSSYRSIISGTYEYGEGNDTDEIDLELHFRFKDTFPETSRLYQFHSFEGTFYTEDGTGTPTVCETYNDRAFFFEPHVYSWTQGSNFVTGCDEKWIEVGMAMVSGLSDKFPNEFRPLATWDEVTIEIPQGMHFNNKVRALWWPNIMPGNEIPDATNGGLNYSVSGNLVTITKGPDFTYIDQGGNNYPTLGISVYATSQTPSLSNHDLSIEWDKFAYTDTPEAITNNYNESFNYYNVQYNLTANQTNVSGSSLIESFTIDICKQWNTATTDFNWLRVETGGNFQITSAVEEWPNAGTTYNVVEANGVYYIEYGSLGWTDDRCRLIKFEGTYTNCSPIDVNVSQNYDCIAYPTDYSTTAFFHEQTFTLDPVDAVAQLAILSQPTTTVDMCDNYNIELEVRNAGGGDLIDPVLTFEIPGDITGLEIVNGTVDIEYPRNSGNIEQITPQISGNTVTINLSDHTEIGGQNGMFGSLNSASIDEQIAIVTMTMSPQCNFRSNTGTTYEITGKSPCGANATGSGSRLSSNPIILTGAEPPYSTNNITLNTPTINGCDNGSIEVETHIVDGTTGSNDFTRITLPAGLLYVPGSFTSTGTVTASYVSETMVGGEQVIEIELPSGASTSDLIAYDFDVESTAAICAGNYTIDLSTYVTTSGLTCGGVSCGTTEIVTGQADTQISVAKAVLDQASFTPTATYVSGGAGTDYDVEIGLENTGTIDLASGITYEVFCADGSGTKVGSAIYNGALTQGIAVGSSIQETFSFNSSTFCGVDSNIVVEFAPGASNCFCTALSVVIASELIVDQCDPVSSGNPDTDGDGVSDVCDLDDDNDGILDIEEVSDKLRSYQAPEGSNLASYYVYQFSGNSEAVSFYREPQLLGWMFDSAPSDLIYNGITEVFGGAQKNLSDIDALTFAEAKSNGEYFQSTFTTGVDLVDPYLRQVHIEWDSNDVADDYSARLEVIVGGVVVYTSPEKRISPSTADFTSGTRGFYLVKPDLASHWLALSDNTTYTVRTYVYDVDASSSIEDFVIVDDATYRFSAALGKDTDDDTIYNHLDLDSDNDGCVDAIEAGHTDPDNDGYLGNSPVSVNATGLVAGQGGYTGTTGNEIIATQVTLNSPPTDQTVNNGDSASFTIDVSAVNTTTFSTGNPDYGSGTNSSTQLRYQWQENGSDLSNGGVYSGVNSATLSISDVTGLHDNSYTVLVSHLDNECYSISPNASLIVIPDITINDSSTVEGTNNVFTITASHSVNQDIVFNVNYANITTTNTDYSGPLTVTLMANATSVSFNVAAVDDALLEPTETHETIISYGSGPSVNITDDTGIGTITDNDGGGAGDGISVADFTVNENVGTVDFVITYTGPTVADAFTVDFAVADGSAISPADYTVVAATDNVGFPANTATGTTQTVTVTIVDDAVLEASEDLSITLSNISNVLVAMVDADGTGTITDNDGGGAGDGISVADFTVNENVGTTGFVITYTGPTVADAFTVDFTVADGSAISPADYTVVAATGNVSFPANTATGTTQTVTVTIVDDAVLEASEDLSITLSNISNVLVAMVDADGTGTITDNDGGGAGDGISVADFTVNENVGTTGFVITYTGPTVADAFTVDFAVADGSAISPDDYTVAAATGNVGFPANTATGTTQTVTVTIVDDAVLETSEDMNIALSNISNALIAMVDGDGTGTITDNDLEICNDGIDNDGDGLVDCDDPDCYLAANSGSLDSDGDGIGDSCDLDNDNDGILNKDECAINTTLQIAGNPTTLNGIPLTSESNLVTGDIIEVTNVGVLSDGTNLVIRIVIEEVVTGPAFDSSGGETGAFYNPATGFMAIEQFDPTNDSHIKFYIEVLDANTGSPLTVFGEAVFKDIDSQGGRDFTEVLGIGPGLSPSLGTNLAPINYVNGNGPGVDQTYYGQNPALLGDPNNWSDEENNNANTIENWATITYGYINRLNFSYGVTGSQLGFNSMGNRAFGLTDIGVREYCDTDNDGLPDVIDIDSDNDGCVDAIEAGHTDPDGDGHLGNSPVSVNDQGLVTGQGGYTGTTPEVITPNQNVTINTAPNDQNVNEGGNASFSVAVSGIGLTYQWQVSSDAGTNWAPIIEGGIYSGVRTTQLTLTNIPFSENSNYYRLLVTDPGNLCNPNYFSNAAILTVVSSFVDIDSDDDGILDSFEDLNADGDNDPTTNPTDSDGDGYPDYLDIDSDNDGIPDNVEAQTTTGYIPPILEDVNDNGLDDAYEVDGELGLVPVNTDGEDLPDYLDNDSDNDNVSDAVEGNDQNHDGIPDVVFIGSDKDNDGLDDNFEGNEQIDIDVNDEINSPIDDLPNTDGDDESDYRDLDDDGDGIPTTDEDTNEDMDYSNDDWDNDGIPDYLDPDTIPEIEDVTVFNVVTPNGDGTHDYLVITGLDVRPNNNIQIYNRWGVLIFSTMSYNTEGNTFDGTSQARATYKEGDKLPTGTYFYILNYEDLDGTSKSLSGYLYLN